MKKIKAIEIRLGALTGFSPEHFREHFYEAAVGTPAEHARLIVKLEEDPLATDAQSIVLEGLDIEQQ